MKETEKVPYDSMPPLIRGSFLTKEQVEKFKELFKDVVSVTRCNDCKHWEPERDGYCPHNHIYTVPDWFCADGEQK